MPRASNLRLPIGGRTMVAAVFGDPVEHSLSPAMHNAAYAALAMNRVYLAFHVTIDKLPEALRAIPALNLLGVNLTVPHKQEALHTVTNLSAEARLLGAANCIVAREGALFGDNTDARGLERDLRELGVTLAGRTAIVIGAGGAAAAAVLAAIRMEAGHIIVVNRTASRAKDLAKRFSATRGSTKIDTAGLDALKYPGVLGAAAIVLNATPMGLKTAHFAPIEYAATTPECFFYDLVYAPQVTPFLKPAADAGRRVADGAGMLLHQGVLAFELFNEVGAPVEAMRRGLMDALGRGMRGVSRVARITQT
ncbi:MAG: shikimate dehydrogenase [Candidatus Binataceae bacterium]|nr:shikimate dehydrogenase [Candidatus Binataceae bacterium]